MDSEQYRAELEQKFGQNCEKMQSVAELNMPSLTANYVCAHRAMATNDPLFAPFFSDVWASKMAGDIGFKRVQQVDEKGYVYPTIVVRSIFFDLYIKRLVEHFDVKQIVILGAGYDSRAARMPFPNVQYFEVDFEASMASKLKILNSIPDYPKQNAKYVVHNLENQQDSFLNSLKKAGYNCELPTVFLWEGVTMYLTEQAIKYTLQTIAQSSVTSNVFILFDYFTRKIRTAHENEPFKFYIEDPTMLLASAGFNRAKKVRMDELYFNLFGTYKNLTAGGVCVAGCIRDAKFAHSCFFV